MLFEPASSTWSFVGSSATATSACTPVSFETFTCSSGCADRTAASATAVRVQASAAKKTTVRLDRSRILLVQHRDSGRGGERPGDRDDVRPRHCRAAERLDAAEPVELAPA